MSFSCDRVRVSTGLVALTMTARPSSARTCSHCGEVILPESRELPHLGRTHATRTHRDVREALVERGQRAFRIGNFHVDAREPRRSGRPAGHGVRRALRRRHALQLSPAFRREERQQQIVHQVGADGRRSVDAQHRLARRGVFRRDSRGRVGGASCERPRRKQRRGKTGETRNVRAHEVKTRGCGNWIGSLASESNGRTRAARQDGVRSIRS